MEENAFDWNDLLCCMRQRSVIPIVGRELLTVLLDGREVLLDTYLAEQLARRLGVRTEGLGAPPGLDAVASAYLDRRDNPGKIYRTLKEIMDERKFPTPPSLTKLAEITDFTLFVTTTFDSLLAQALTEQRPGELSPERLLVYSRNKHPTDEDYDLPTAWKGVSGLYLHHLFGTPGTANTVEGDFAVTEADYLEFVHQLSEGKRPPNLFREFEKHHMLFLGCGFENWFERFFIRTVRGREFSPAYERTMQFVADREAGGDEKLTVFLQLYRVQVFPDGDAVQFVDALYRRWRALHPKTGTRDTGPPLLPIESGMVFLSYVGEDAAAARNLSGALTDAGLDVWFDKEAVQPGALWESEIQAGIDRCAVFVPLLSRRAQEKEESVARMEWSLAIKRNTRMKTQTRFILPVVLAEDPPEKDKSGIPQEFWELSYRDFPRGQPDAKFVDQVKELVKSRRKREGGYR